MAVTGHLPADNSTPLPLHTHAQAQRPCARAVENTADTADDPDVPSLADVHRRIAPVRMVENVDRGKLGVQLQCLPERHLLIDADIETVHARPFDGSLRR